MAGAEVLFAFLLIAVLTALYRWVKSLKLQRVVLFDYQRGVSYRSGVFERLLGPGRYWVNATRTITAVDIRKQLLTLPGQEILTTDGIAVKLSGTIEYNIADPLLMLTASSNFHGMLYAYSQQSLRTVVSELAFEVLLTGREVIAQRTLALLTPRAASLGASIAAAQINDIMLPAEIRRAFAQSVTAQKEGLAALERARGETAALRSLSNAARLTADHPGLLHLRALQTLDTTKGNATLELRLGDPGRPGEPRSEA